ncbi:MAG: phosphoesterase [Deltaproteobacteria bacterium]|nr:MAG: phosphoesterase [Deltaproteobacteria bacterium]
MNETVTERIPEQIVRELEQHDNVALFTHSHPDGDALGSMLGLAALLESLDKRVFCLLEEPVSYLYRFLPGRERLESNLENFQEFMGAAAGNVACVALDCGNAGRLGSLQRQVLRYSPLVVIDHHRSHEYFGTTSWVEPSCSSTGEMVYELAQLLCARMSYEAAFNLYVAISTDTGSFRYETTSARTMQIAGELLDNGVKAEEVSAFLYDNYTRERLHLLGRALDSVELLIEDRVALMTVSQQMLQETGASLQDLEGFIDIPRAVNSVKVAVLFKEKSDGGVAVSMRAKGECNVAAVAKKFGGGGHKNAAGFHLDTVSLPTVRRELLAILQSLVG